MELYKIPLAPCGRCLGEGVGNRARPSLLDTGRGVGGVPDFIRAARLILPFHAPPVTGLQERL